MLWITTRVLKKAPWRPGEFADVGITASGEATGNPSSNTCLNGIGVSDKAGVQRQDIKARQIMVRFICPH